MHVQSEATLQLANLHPEVLKSHTLATHSCSQTALNFSFGQAAGKEMHFKFQQPLLVSCL